MSDQFAELLNTSKYLLPWSTFLIGLLGSVHCVGMCGGLVVSCAPRMTNNISYQIGRLTSYGILAMLAGVLGSFLNFRESDPVISVVSGSIIGLMFIWFGLKRFVTSSSKLKLPHFLEKTIYKLWSKFLPKGKENISVVSSFMVGSFSIFLPCGLLYSVLLALGAFQSPLLALLCIFTFWLGTLPLMSFAPEILVKLLRPLSLKLPLVTSSTLVLIGVVTIAHRLYSLYHVAPTCHH